MTGGHDTLPPAQRQQALEAFLRVLIRSGLRRDTVGWFAEYTGLVYPFSVEASDALGHNGC